MMVMMMDDDDDDDTISTDCCEGTVTWVHTAHYGKQR